MVEPDQRNFWLWVTRPEYYLDEDGSDREILDPNYDEQGWWTCHRDTKRGDLVLLWRTSPKSDIGYLIQAKSDAYTILDENDRGWPYGCEYKAFYKFESPVNLKDLKNNRFLDEWPPLRGNFQRSVYRIKPEDWDRLKGLLIQRNIGYKEIIESLEKRPVAEILELERKLEERLAHDFSLLKKFGYDLELYIDPKNPEITGRQLVCKGSGGVIDFLCYDKSENRYVVIELKINQARQDTVGQILNYMGWVKDRIAGERSVVGLVISNGYDTKFESALKVTDRITQLNIDLLGFKVRSSKTKDLVLKEVAEQKSEPIEIHQDSKNARTWLNKGNALLGKGQYDAAISCYDKAMDIDSSNKWGWIYKGTALALMGKQVEAIKCYDKAIDLSPRTSAAWYRKACSLVDLEKYEEALKCFDKAISLKPNFHPAWIGKGDALNGLNRYDEAIRAYDEAIVLRPKDPVARFDKGGALMNQGKHDEAIQAYDEAIRLDPNGAATWYNKGIALGNQGKHDEAIEAFDEAIRLDPNGAAAWYNKGVALGNQGKHDEAIQAYDEVIRLDPNYVAAWNNKGEALIELDKCDEGINAYDEAIRLNPEDADTWNNKGIALGNQGEYDKAIQSYDEAIRLDPNGAATWYNKGVALGDQGKYAEAIKCYDEAIRLDPQDADFWNNKGLALNVSGKTSEANAAIAKAKDLGFEE